MYYNNLYYVGELIVVATGPNLGFFAQFAN